MLYGPDGKPLPPRPTEKQKTPLVAVLVALGIYAACGWIYFNKPKPPITATSVATEPTASYLPYTEYRDIPKEWPQFVFASCGLYRVKYTSAEELMRHGALAQTSMETRTIWLRFDASNAEQQEDLLHELLHVALYCRGGMDSNLESHGVEEEFVNPSSKGLIRILQDNPDVAKWIETKTPLKEKK